MAAEHETQTRLIAAYSPIGIGARFAARVSGLTRTVVRLNETGADGFVRLLHRPRIFLYHDENSQALIGEETGAAFQLGDVLWRVQAIPSAGAP